MFHGDRDMNVSVSASRLMKGRLEAAGKRVDYVEFPDLAHALDVLLPARGSCRKAISLYARHWDFNPGSIIFRSGSKPARPLAQTQRKRRAPCETRLSVCSRKASEAQGRCQASPIDCGFMVGAGGPSS